MNIKELNSLENVVEIENKRSQKPKYRNYTLEVEKLNKIIKNEFPKIIRNGRTLYLYDSSEKYYIEIEDNDDVSHLDSIIYDRFRNIKDIKNKDGEVEKTKIETLKISELKNLKSYIKKGYKFNTLIDPGSQFFNCKNGVLDLETGELDKDHSKYFFTYKPTVIYNKNADTKKLYDFIKSVMTDNEPIDLLSKILAHIHYSGDKLHKMFLFYGTKAGRNGKGTLTRLIVKLIGSERTLTKSLNDFTEDKHSTCALKNKVLYIEDDYKLSYMNDRTIGFLNKVITGIKEDVNPKHKTSYMLEYKAVPIIQCNKLPKIKAEDDGGFYARWTIINFKNEFGGKMNEFLGSSLIEDDNVISSMLNLLISGYIKILDRKNNNIRGNFFKDDEISHIEDWKKNNNSALQFVEECCSLDEGGQCGSMRLYDHYVTEFNRNSKKLSETKFIKSIKDFYKLESVRIRIDTYKGKKQITVLNGIVCNDGSLINIEQNKYV